MADLSNISVTGRLCRDAEPAQFGASSAVRFDIAVNTGWGQYQRTAFYTVTLWGKAGQNVLPYLTKGKQVAVGGEFDVQAYQDPNGHEKFKLCISSNRVTLLGGGEMQNVQSNPTWSGDSDVSQKHHQADEIPVF